MDKRRSVMRSVCLRDAEARTLAETGECVIERPVKPQPEHGGGTIWSWQFPKPDRYGVSGITGSAEGLAIALREYSPLGQPGEQRWCKEAWSPAIYLQSAWYRADNETIDGEPVCEEYLPAITMPRWASRFTVEVLSTEAILRDGVWYWTARVRRVE